MRSEKTDYMEIRRRPVLQPREPEKNKGNARDQMRIRQACDSGVSGGETGGEITGLTTRAKLKVRAGTMAFMRGVDCISVRPDASRDLTTNVALSLLEQMIEQAREDTGHMPPMEPLRCWQQSWPGRAQGALAGRRFNG